MKIFPETTSGHIVKLKTTNPLHYSGETKKPLDDDVSTSFANVLKNAIGKVNNLQVESHDLAQQMITEPESVDIHNVMIAAQKAEISLNFAKTVRDEAVRSFRELMNMR